VNEYLEVLKEDRDFFIEEILNPSRRIALSTPSARGLSWPIAESVKLTVPKETPHWLVHSNKPTGVAKARRNRKGKK